MKLARFLVAIPIFLLSCSSYDYRYTQSKWVMLQRYGTLRCFLADDSVVLQPTTVLDSSFFIIGNRYKVYYQSLGSNGVYSLGATAKLVLVESAVPVLTKDIDSIYTGVNNQPIFLNERPFISGGFINFDFGYYKESNNHHSFLLVQDSVKDGKGYLRFIHDASTDRAILSVLKLASFSLSSLKNPLSIDSLLISYKKLGGVSSEGVTSYVRLALKDTLPR